MAARALGLLRARGYAPRLNAASQCRGPMPRLHAVIHCGLMPRHLGDGREDPAHAEDEDEWRHLPRAVGVEQHGQPALHLGG